MSAPQPDPRAQLREAAAREAVAARDLAGTLREAREAAQRMDAGALGAVLEGARRAADDLARAGGRRTRLATEVARLTGLSAETSLGRLLAEVEPQGGPAQELLETLEAVSREASALGICVRYGGFVARHLAALTRSGPCYGPGGQLGSGPRLAGRTA